MTTYAEKLLPHDVEAEEAVLGSILIDGECLTRLCDPARRRRTGSPSLTSRPSLPQDFFSMHGER